MIRRASFALRSNAQILFCLNVALVIFAFLQIFDVVTQLNDRALMNWAITRDEIKANYEAPQLIPNIIHQTYKTKEIPERWASVQETIAETNPDYTYILWTDETARNLIATHYPWFLKTFDSYKYPIMRADALRYFILYHYGGFYIDLDIGLKESLDDLRHYPSLFYKTSPTGVSNDFMACAPRHPFMLYAINALSKYKGNYFVPYFTVMYSTGPLFLSVILQWYNMLKSRTGAAATRIFVLHDEPASKHKPLADYIFHVAGSIWHQGDACLFTYISRHLFLSIIVGCLLGFAVLALVLMIEMRLLKLIQLLLRRYRAKDTFPVPQHERLKQA